MRIDLLSFGNAAPDRAVIAFFAIAATLFVHCNLMRRTWFIGFLAAAAAAHLALVMMFPSVDLDPVQFKMFAFSDVLAVIGLVFVVEKLLSLRKSSPQSMSGSFALEPVPLRARTSC